MGDWTYEYYFSHHLHREPDAWERAAIRRENAAILHARGAAVLFADSAAQMQARYPGRDIRFLGAYINAVREPEPQLPTQKFASCQLLFIGHRGYLAGARALIAAARQLRAHGIAAEVECIGLTPENLENEERTLDFVHCHGYLSKGDAAQCEAYYALMRKARVCVNTTPGWSAMSSVMEEMYFYCPVLTQPNENFVRAFGEQATFGAYCSNEPAQIADALAHIFSLKEEAYTALCRAAHDAVAGCSWYRWAQKLLEMAQQIKNL